MTDSDPDAIERAKSAAEHMHCSVEFIAADGAQLPIEWSDQFDLILVFDAIHDQCRPDFGLREIHRCLRPGGLFAMLETNSTGNCHGDRIRLGSEASSYYYAISVFHCLPVGSNQPDSLQLGNMWGEPRGRQLLAEAGFGKVTVEELPYFPLNLLYKAVKGKSDSSWIRRIRQWIRSDKAHR